VITKTLTGSAVGAGLEYALGGGWSIKGEYLQLGSKITARRGIAMRRHLIDGKRSNFDAPSISHRVRRRGLFLFSHPSAAAISACRPID
jgi:hypothetical protein